MKTERLKSVLFTMLVAGGIYSAYMILSEKDGIFILVLMLILVCLLKFFTCPMYEEKEEIETVGHYDPQSTISLNADARRRLQLLLNEAGAEVVAAGCMKIIDSKLAIQPNQAAIFLNISNASRGYYFATYYTSQDLIETAPPMGQFFVLDSDHLWDIWLDFLATL